MKYKRGDHEFSSTYLRARENFKLNKVFSQALKNGELYFFLSKNLKECQSTFCHEIQGRPPGIFHHVYTYTQANKTYKLSWSLTFSKLFFSIARNLTDRPATFLDTNIRYTFSYRT